MNRRSLLRMLLAAPLAATFDVERLLWVPGQMVAVPAMPRNTFITPEWVAKEVAITFAHRLRIGDLISIGGAGGVQSMFMVSGHVSGNTHLCEPYDVWRAEFPKRTGIPWRQNIDNVTNSVSE